MWNWIAQKIYSIFTIWVPGSLQNGSAHILTCFCVYNFCLIRFNTAGEVPMEMYTSRFLFSGNNFQETWIFVWYMSVVVPPLHQQAFQFSAIPACSVVKALSEGKAHQAGHASFCISQVIFPFVLWLETDICWQQSGTAGSENISKGYHEKELRVLVVSGLFVSFLWQPEVPSDDKEGDSTKTFRIWVA